MGLGMLIHYTCIWVAHVYGLLTHYTGIWVAHSPHLYMGLGMLIHYTCIWVLFTILLYSLCIALRAPVHYTYRNFVCYMYS